MRRCPSCHGENPDDAKFCVHCGFSLDWETEREDQDGDKEDTAVIEPAESARVSPEPGLAAQTAPPVAATAPEAEAAPVVHRGGLRLWPILLAAVAVAAVVVVAVVLASRGGGGGGEVQGTVVAVSGVRVHESPQGEVVRPGLDKGVEIVISCQTIKDGLRWFQLEEPSEDKGSWVAEKQGSLTIVEVSGTPEDC